MWNVLGKNLSMAEGDYGVPLPILVVGAELTASDSLKFIFKSKVNGSAILEKEYVPVDNALTLELTEAETALFSVGQYVYSVDWYQSGVFNCNIIPMGILRVVDKA